MGRRGDLHAVSLVVEGRTPNGFDCGRRKHEGRWIVALAFEGGRAFAFSWQRADEYARKLRHAVAELEDGETLVRIDLPGATYLLPIAGAVDVHRALIAKARECEEQEAAESIAYDAAILARAGANFGLSSDPAIQAEALKIAQWDTNLRRYMRTSPRARVLGAPRIINHGPKATP